MTQIRQTPRSPEPSAAAPHRTFDGTENPYFDLFDRAPVGYFTLDETGRIREANLTFSTLLGCSPAALLLQPLSSLICPEDRDRWDHFHQALAGSCLPQSCDLRMAKNNGTIFWGHLTAASAPDAPTCRVILCDLTPHVQSEQFLRRLYVVLAQVNQAVVHFRQRDELFREICQIAVKSGHFRMAWIGLVDEPTGRLKPIAHAGHEEGYLKTIHVNVNPDSAFSQGPSGQAILQNRVMAIPDFETAPQASPWRNEALKHGYRASISMPFCLKKKPIGSLNLYVDAPGSCSEEELDLLKRIGHTLSFALDCLEIEKSRLQAEAALRKSEAQNRAFIHAIPDLIFMNKRDGEYLVVHAPDSRLLAAPPDDVLHRKIGELLPKPIADRCLKAIAAALDSRTLQKLTYTLPIDGWKRRFEARIAPCTPDTVLTIVRDITKPESIGAAPPSHKPRRR